MNENGIPNIIVNTVFQIHQTLGPGLLESVTELIKNGIRRVVNDLIE